METITADETLWTIEDVKRRVRACDSNISRWRREGHFPRPVRLPGSRRLLWRASDIAQWIRSLPLAENEMTTERSVSV